MSVDFEFLKDIVLISIPTVTGAIISWVITHRWQERKEKNIIRRKLLEEIDNSFTKTHFVFSKTNVKIMMNYWDISEEVTIKEGKAESGNLIDSEDMYPPKIRFKQYYEDFFEDDAVAISGSWNLQSSLALYSDLEITEKKFF